MLAYKNWKSKTGPAHVITEQVEYLGKHKRPNGYQTKFKLDGVTYEGEVWKCKVQGIKPLQTFVFRTEFIEDEEVGWPYNKLKDQPIDIWVNPIVDEPEDYLTYLKQIPNIPVRKRKNRELIRLEKEDKDLLKKHQKYYNLLDEDHELKIPLKLKIKFMKTPTISNMRMWNKIGRDLKYKINNDINYIV